MSGFLLVPVDGGDPVPVPPGDTLLGRGPLFRVSDKRVSRHHGLLQNLNGELRLKPTHVNPCFIQAVPSSEPRPLPKGSWYTLRDGELVSLLPGRLVFRVEAVGAEERTSRSSRSSEEDEQLPASSEPRGEAPADEGQERPAGEPKEGEESNRRSREVRVSCPPPCPEIRWNLDEETPTAETLFTEIKVSGSAKSPSRRFSKASTMKAFVKRKCFSETFSSFKSCFCSSQTNMEAQRDAALSEVRVRILPAWMMAAAGHSPALTLKVQSAVHRRQQPAGAVQATPTSSSLPEEEEEQRKKRKMNVEEEQSLETGVPAGASALPSWREPSRPKVKSTTGRLTENADDLGGSSTKAPEINQSEDITTSVLAPPIATPTTQRRTPCPYGKDCYRKNPLHFQESSHPGDSDYEEVEEAEDRPECLYGTDCYRKNPVHRREYKHTKKPARSTRAIPRNTPDEEEGEDSFIDDDSEDLDNDSDYNPAPSDDSDGEDVKRLQREATSFLKRRK